MGDLTRVRIALGGAIVGLLVVALAPPGVSAVQPQATLKVSPGLYVGGQALTIEGNIGRLGVQRVRLQFNMGRPGDTWGDPAGGSTWTKPDGSFRFTYPAPSMFGILVRVASGRAATPAKTLNARSQDLVLTAVPTTRGLGPGQVLAGERFAIEVDTTPTIRGRTDLPGPAFKDRTLTLQKRVDGDRWQDLGTTTTDGEGQGRFEQTVAEPGTVVYRVRQESLTTNGNEIGWFPSFPTYVEVLPTTGRAVAPLAATGTARQTPRQAAPRGSSRASTPEFRTVGGKPLTASKAHGWARPLWDFAWEYGESLTSKPVRGSDPSGWWSDASNGSGRAAKHNGGLMLDSQRESHGPGDHGTTSATLRGNPMKYGRWETKLRLKSPENNARDYRVRVELVPDRPGDYHCGAQNITVADIAAHGPHITVGARAMRGARKWTYRKRIGSLNGTSAAFAVEVTKRHISWFVNGRVIATLRSEAAVSDVPLTLRLSLVGDGQEEMNRTAAISDWQRAFSLTRGKQTTSGHPLRQGTYAGGC